MRRCHPASGCTPALNSRCFLASRFPLLRPTKSQPPFQGNLSEGSVLFIEFLHFYHLGTQERKHGLANAYFPWALTANSWATGITVTAKGVPASSPTKGSAPPIWLPPSIEFS